MLAPPFGPIGLPEVVILVVIFLIIFGPSLFRAGPRGPSDPFSS